MRFDVLVAEPSAQTDPPETGENHTAVGGITFNSGRRVWVNAVPMLLDDDHLAQIESERKVAAAVLPRPGGSSLAWGVFGGYGGPETPFLLDLAHV